MNDRMEIAAELRELRHKTYYNEEIVDNIVDCPNCGYRIVETNSGEDNNSER